MFTSHGHHIFGTIYEKRPEDMMVVRCGGPGLCKLCSQEAARVGQEESSSVSVESLTENSIISKELYPQDEKTEGAEPQYLSDSELRLKCLREAIYSYGETKSNPNSAYIVARAEIFFNYVRNGNREENN